MIFLGWADRHWLLVIQLFDFLTCEEECPPKEVALLVGQFMDIMGWDR